MNVFFDFIGNKGSAGLSEDIRIVARDYCDYALICAEHSPESEACKHINKKSIKRFLATVENLIGEMENIPYYQQKKLEKQYENQILGFKMKLWIFLGSVLESTMQIFLSVYLYDYKNSNWKVWIGVEEEKLTKRIFPVIDTLVNEGEIDHKQKKSLKNVLKKEIEKHKSISDVTKMMLEELIVFYHKNNICNKEEIEKLRLIQKNRNCIHSYREREVDSYWELINSILFLVDFMKKLMRRFPDMSYLNDY